MVTRTFDVGFIGSVINHPDIREELTDGAPLEVPMHDSIYYLKPTIEKYADGAVEDVPIGVMGFIPVNGVTWNPHIAILPEHRGLGTKALKTGIDWMFQNTPCKKIVAYPPAFNTRMIRVFEKCGFELEGWSKASFPWHGVLHDRALMGLEKE